MTQAVQCSTWNRPVRLLVQQSQVSDLEILGRLDDEEIEVTGALTVNSILRLAGSIRPDVVAFDLACPDAAEGPRRFRESWKGREPQPKILILHGLKEAMLKAELMVDDADDSICRPFGVSELAGRVKQLIGPAASVPVRVDIDRLTVTVDRRTRTVTVNDETIELTAKEFNLLAELATDPERVFTRKELIRDLWGYQEPRYTRTLEAHASRLRRKLDPDESRLIINCRGVGYRLISPSDPWPVEGEKHRESPCGA